MTYNFDEIIERRGTDSIKWGLYGKNVLPLWVADSDFRCDPAITEAICARLGHNLLGYPNQHELMEEAVRHWLSSRFGWQAPKGSTAFTPGVCAGIALCIRAFSQPGDFIATLTPAYPPLLNLPVLNGRVSLPSDLLHENGKYKVNYEDLKEKLARSRTSLLLLCNPHNPTGKVFARDELLRIGELCLEHKVLVISDEIHCDYVFGGRHVTFPSLSPELAARSIVTINPSKTFNIAGLFTAAAVSANPDLTARLKDILRASSLEASIPGAIALHTAYTRCADYADAVNAYTKNNVSFAVNFIKKHIPGLKAAMPEGTYLLWIDCSGLGLNDEELDAFFLKKAEVALNSGPHYGAAGKGHMRLNCACARATLEEGLGRIARAVNELLLA